MAKKQVMKVVPAVRLVPVWYDENSARVCRDCAKDARAGGARLHSSWTLPGLRECDYCFQPIGGAP